MSRAPAPPVPFIFDARFPRVIFGRGTRARVVEELAGLGLQRVLLIATPGRARVLTELQQAVQPRLAGVFDGARQHVPPATLEQARAAGESERADGYLSVGGGSATGLAKALALETGLPIVAIPTTYAGSEVTPVWGITDGERKITGRDDRVLPRVVIYDPELTLDIPPRLTGSSGLNAIAHCVEAIYATDANPITSLIAEEGISVLAKSLPALSSNPGDVDGRTTALYGAYLAGTALASVTMGLHHRVCHLLGGAFDLPHAETHAVLLPHVVALKARSEPRMSRVAAALGSDSAATALHKLRVAVHAPRSLQEIGLAESMLDKAVALVGAMQDADGPLLREGDARSLLEHAFRGEPPQAH